MQVMGKYLYCFIGESKPVSLGVSSIGGVDAPVYALPRGKVAAVVSDAPVTDYDPTRKNLLAHQKVVGAVMKRYTVIPVAFGTVGGGKKDVEAVIAAHHDRFLELLEYLRDKTELGLRVTWKDDRFGEDIETDSIRELKSRVAGKDEEEVLADKIELGKQVEASLAARREEYEKAIYEPLRELAADSRLKESVPIKTVFSAYFLVDEPRSGVFDDKVEALYERYGGKLDFNYTGPWPAYNFVDMAIHF